MYSIDKLFNIYPEFSHLVYNLLAFKQYIIEKNELTKETLKFCSYFYVELQRWRLALKTTYRYREQISVQINFGNASHKPLQVCIAIVRSNKVGELCHLFHLRFTLIKILKIENYKSLLNPMSWSQEISKISKDLCFSVETSNESECPVLLCRKHDLFNDRLLHRFKFVKKITTFNGIC